MHIPKSRCTHTKAQQKLCPVSNVLLQLITWLTSVALASCFELREPCFRSTNSATGRRTSAASHHVHSSDTAAEAASSCDTSSISDSADEDRGEPASAPAAAGRRTTGGALGGHQEQHDAAESAAAATAAGRAPAERPGTDTPPGENDGCGCSGGRQHRAEVDIDDTGRHVELTHRHDAGVARHRDAAHRAGSGAIYEGDNATASSRCQRRWRRESPVEAGAGVSSDADGRGDAGEDAGWTADTHQDGCARCCSGDIDCSGSRYPQRWADGEGGGGSVRGEVHGHATGGAAR